MRTPFDTPPTKVRLVSADGCSRDDIAFPPDILFNHRDIEVEISRSIKWISYDHAIELKVHPSKLTRRYAYYRQQSETIDGKYGLLFIYREVV